MGGKGGGRGRGFGRVARLHPASGRREAALRFATGVVCGLVFGGTAGLKIATELGIARTIGSIELLLMGSAVVSLCAWWALGVLARAFERGGWARSKERRESDER